MTVSHADLSNDALREMIDRLLAAQLDLRALPSNLDEACRYALLAPGKRLRPILVLRTAAALGGDIEAAHLPTAAIEMVHAFSLVHDDLPAMDDDDLRRGRPTVHVRFGEPMAILVGDLLSGMAFELIGRRMADPTLAGRLCGELSTATGDMIVGQVYDTLGGFPESLDDRTKVEMIARYKTGALIRCACRMGAIVAGASNDELARITSYGEAIGVMFQVIDDLLDVTQTTEHLGKKAGKDNDAGKLTSPGVMGIDAARAYVDDLRRTAIEALAEFGPEAGPLRELCETMAVRTR
ncbi:MAG: polyprenyl synthetase family protein [Phycisphaerales bacterium]|nr:polyprenyl synthetase family protein [Phycisphaerales bacterium]